MQKELVHESHKVQEEEIGKRIANYLEKKRAQLVQPKVSPYVPSAEFNVAFLESGHGDEAVPDNGGMNARRVPACTALETSWPNESMDKYSVVLSEPHVDSGALIFNGTKAFGRLESANYYAREILNDQTPPGTTQKSKQKQHAFSHVYYGKVNDLFWGRGKLSGGKDDGKWLTVMVHKEKQMVGDLDPDALRNRYVDQQVLDKYARHIYEVFLINSVPKYFREAELADQKRLALSKRQETRVFNEKQMQEQSLQEQAEDPVGEKEVGNGGLEGDELRRMLANLRPPGTPQAYADADDVEVDEDLSESVSQASGDSHLSEGTFCSSNHADFFYERQTAFVGVETDVFSFCSFTSLHEANKCALSVARARWKPRNASIYANSHWAENILPYLDQEERMMMEAGDEELHLVFPGFESGVSHTDHRPWGFTYSQLRVFKKELSGPVDLGIDYVLDVNDVYKATSFDRVIERVEQAEAQGVAGIAAGGQEQGPEGVELLDKQSLAQGSSDDGEYSEEE